MGYAVCMNVMAFVVEHIVSFKSVLQSHLPKVYIKIAYSKTELSLMAFMSFQNSYDTGVGTLVSMTTKRIELLIGQKNSKTCTQCNITMKIYLLPG